MMKWEMNPKKNFLEVEITQKRSKFVKPSQIGNCSLRVTHQMQEMPEWTHEEDQSQVEVKMSIAHIQVGTHLILTELLILTTLTPLNTSAKINMTTMVATKHRTKVEDILSTNEVTEVTPKVIGIQIVAHPLQNSTNHSHHTKTTFIMAKSLVNQITMKEI